MEIRVKLDCHEHHLTLSSGFAFRCHWCQTGGYINNGYHCTECDIWFHNNCTNLEFPWEIRHSYHPEHILIRTYLFSWDRVWCGVCRRLIYEINCYMCSRCKKFSIHISCSIEPPPLTIKHPQAHEHSLALVPVSRNPEHLCEACKENVVEPLAYRCFKCEVSLHVQCVNSPEVNHPYHKHSLKLLTSGAPDYTDNTCLLCGLVLKHVLYHCSICNFSVCLVCESIPQLVDVEHLKTHAHKLILMARKISFTCNACGMKGKHSPYFCLQCDFMIHRSCIGLPHVININRHNHRLSYTQQLSFGDWNCEICLQKFNRFYGAYTCSVCNNYFVHSKCATGNDVWDGIELEGFPEETEDIMPFKEVSDNVINHFSHEDHNLILKKDGISHGGSINCEACIIPVLSDPVYNCEQCGFILHEICASLPRRKKHMFHNKQFILHVEDMDFQNFLPCSGCGDYFSGFRYKSDNIVLDVRCILTSDIFFTEKHEHRLHYNKFYVGKCDACDGSVKSGAFSCALCNYNLGFCCINLPKSVKHISDQHVLYLSCKENASGKYWCDICEEELDPKKWFYTCDDCEVAMHVKCILGDLYRIKPGKIFELRDLVYEVIPNNHSSRPICCKCKLRCKAPLIIKLWQRQNLFYCSQRCLLGYEEMDEYVPILGKKYMMRSWRRLI